MQKREVERALKRALKAKQQKLIDSRLHGDREVTDLRLRMPVGDKGVPQLLVRYSVVWKSRRGNLVRKSYATTMRPLFCPLTGEPMPQEE